MKRLGEIEFKEKYLEYLKREGRYDDYEDAMHNPYLVHNYYNRLEAYKYWSENEATEKQRDIYKEHYNRALNNPEWFIDVFIRHIQCKMEAVAHTKYD